MLTVLGYRKTLIIQYLHPKNEEDSCENHGIMEKRLTNKP